MTLTTWLIGAIVVVLSYLYGKRRQRIKMELEHKKLTDTLKAGIAVHKEMLAVVQETFESMRSVRLEIEKAEL